MRWPLFALSSTMLALYAPLAPAQQPQCGTALVLLVDISGSINEEEYDLMLDGLSNAFYHKEVKQAIHNQPTGTLAVSVVEFASESQVIIPWQILDPSNSDDFAAKLRHLPRATNLLNMTNIDGGVHTALDYFSALPCQPSQLVIDLQGDGSDSGPPPFTGRNRAEAMEVTINGLAITNDEPEVANYYRQNYQTGLASFVIPVKDWASFGRAILNKLSLEMS